MQSKTVSGIKMLLTYLGLYTDNDNKYEKGLMSIEHNKLLSNKMLVVRLFRSNIPHIRC